jgi:hypothetical protein
MQISGPVCTKERTKSRSQPPQDQILWLASSSTRTPGGAITVVDSYSASTHG